MIAFCIDEAARWSDPLRGMLNGLAHAPILTLLVLGVMLPVMALLWAVASFIGLGRRYTIALPIVLPLGLLLWSVLTAVFWSPDSHERFRLQVGVPLPEGAIDFRAYHSGGGLRDHMDLYSFSSDRRAISEFLGTQPFERVTEYHVSPERPLPLGVLPPGWPNPGTWSDAQIYRLKNTGRICLVITDKEYRHIVVIVTTI